MDGVICNATPHPAHAGTQLGQIPLVGECIKVENGNKNIHCMYYIQKMRVSAQFRILAYSKEKNGLMISPCCVCVSVRPSVFLLFTFLGRLADCHETWYERYTVGDHPNSMLFFFMQLVVTS